MRERKRSKEQILQDLQGARVKYVRDQKLKMSRADFAAKIEISLSALGNIETGAIPLTKRNFNAICRVFNVNPEWLETGMGDEFLPSTGNAYLDEFCEKYGLDGLSRKVFEKYLSFPEDQRKIIADWILKSFDFVDELTTELTSGKAERKKELQAQIKAAQEELNQMEKAERADLLKESSRETG